MKWYYQIAGGHVHVRVFMNESTGKCGNLCFRMEEFDRVLELIAGLEGFHFIDESPVCKACGCKQDRNGCGCNPHDA